MKVPELMEPTAHENATPTSIPNDISNRAVIDVAGVGQLLSLLRKQGYWIFGPTLKDKAITLGELESISDLPVGWTDTQDAASYRMEKHALETLFHYTVGPQSWKQILFPPETCLWRAARSGAEFTIEPGVRREQKLALFGVRPCDLNAILIQDKVYSGGTYKDPGYTKRRSNMLVIAVNCSKAGKTCFCVSMGTGPRVTQSCDLVLTEVCDSRSHYFLIESHSVTGRELLEQLPSHPAQESELDAAEVVVSGTAGQMSRSMETAGLKEFLQKNPENIHWQKVGSRCLNCANCTMVCPTCFCSTVEDITDLTGAAERHRKWDSCFTLDYSYIHGGSIRPSADARYRHWLTHKLASWHDQFGCSGCVGCGRCITWCPVGIDITEEVRAIRKNA